MSFDVAELRRAVARHGRVARVVVADIKGSAPREVGASMLVWDGGQSGTIGGGALEFEAARKALSRRGLSRHPLGPELGQCCGGAVSLWTDVFDAHDLDALSGPVIARGAGDMPLAVARIIDRARGRGIKPAARLVQGWMVEPVLEPTQPVWVWGAGHVGRAIVGVLSPMPELDLTWLDTGRERFPDPCPDHISLHAAPDLGSEVRHAPVNAAHLVLTYSHPLDLAICDALLRHGFGFAGLIGSDTKRARFFKRLAALGHDRTHIDRITCPIGDKSLGKHPQAIAIGVAAQIISIAQRQETAWTTSSSASMG